MGECVMTTFGFETVLAEAYAENDKNKKTM